MTALAAGAGIADLQSTFCRHVRRGGLMAEFQCGIKPHFQNPGWQSARNILGAIILLPLH